MAGKSAARVYVRSWGQGFNVDSWTRGHGASHPDMSRLCDESTRLQWRRLSGVGFLETLDPYPRV